MLRHHLNELIVKQIVKCDWTTGTKVMAESGSASIWIFHKIIIARKSQKFVLGRIRTCAGRAQ